LAGFLELHDEQATVAVLMLLAKLARPFATLCSRAGRSALGSLALATTCACSSPSPSGSGDETALKRSEAADTSNLEEPKPNRAKGREITYTITRGGSLRQVANLYKLYHHEIIALNPGIDPDAQLGPNTELVVFRDAGRDSESIGLPHDGRLSGGWPMPDGPGRKIMAERWKTWASRSTVEQLDHALTRWADLQPAGPHVLVGNLSTRSGGPLDPHKSHQSGRDADLSYIAKWDGKSAVTWQHVTPETIDPELTWKLLRLLVKENQVEAFYIDRSLQRVLLAHAQKTGIIRNSRLAQWLEIAGGGDEALIRHVPGHKDHFHVRLACPSNTQRCK
jgi:murein endopeptidase